MKRLKDEGGQASAITARLLLRNQGQALIEYILILPLIFLLIVNMVNFGGFFYAFIAVSNAARAGADYAIMSVSSVASTNIPTPTASQITDLIKTDIASLPNKSSLSVSVCQNDGGVTTPTGSCLSFADPETNYVLTVIDVTYTYKPFI